MMNTFGIIGTGQMGGAIAKALRERVDGDRILLANRTLKKAQVLAQVLDATAVDNATAAKCSYVILGVKPQKNTDKLAACQALAKYLSNEQSQLDRFESRGWGPSNKAAKDNEAVKANPALTALNGQMPYMIPQGQYPYNYWILTQNLGDSIVAGKYNDANDTQLMEVLTKFQKTSESLQK